MDGKSTGIAAEGSGRRKSAARYPCHTPPFWGVKVFTPPTQWAPRIGKVRPFLDCHKECGKKWRSGGLR